MLLYMGTIFLLLLNLTTSAQASFNMDKCLLEARTLIIASIKAGQPILYDEDPPVTKFAEVFCGCQEKNQRPSLNPKELFQLCYKEADMAFVESLSETTKTFTTKELTRRSTVTACIPEINRIFTPKMEKTSLKDLTPEDRIVALSQAAYPTCECIAGTTAENIFNGHEAKKEFTKEEMEKVKTRMQEYKSSPLGKEQSSTCLLEGHLILPLASIPAYDSKDLFVKECGALSTDLLKIILAIEDNLELVQKYSALFCECAHPKLKGNETKAIIAGICSNEATKVVGKNLNVDMKKDSHQEVYRKSVQATCFENMRNVISVKVESTNLKTLKEETKTKFEALALTSYCECAGKHEAEYSYAGIPDKRKLDHEEEKKFRENKAKYEKSYQRSKSNDACLEGSLNSARKQVADEMRAKGK